MLRALICVLCLAVCDAGAQALVSGRLPRVGVLANTIPLSEVASGTWTHPAARALVDGLRELGWIDGKNVELVFRSAAGDLTRLPGLAEELIGLRVDLLVAWGPGVDAATAKTDRIPIVMGASGIVGRYGPYRVDSLARPGHNVTGMTILVGPELNGKRLALLKQLVPRMARVAFLTQQKDIGFSDVTKRAASELGITIHEFNYPTLEDIAGAFEAIRRERMDAVIVAEEPISNLPATQRVIHHSAQRHRIPVLHMALSSVETGGLIAYGHDIARLYRRAPYFVDRILRGTKPGDIPIEQPAEFELRVNLKAAKAIGLAIPPSILVQADRVIE